MQSWLRTEALEASSYSWCLRSYRVTDQLRVAASRRALELIGMFEGVFGYEVSMDTHAQAVDARLLSLLSRGLGTRLVNLTLLGWHKDSVLEYFELWVDPWCKISKGMISLLYMDKDSVSKNVLHSYTYSFVLGEVGGTNRLLYLKGVWSSRRLQDWSQKVSNLVPPCWVTIVQSSLDQHTEAHCENVPQTSHHLRVPPLDAFLNESCIASLVSRHHSIDEILPYPMCVYFWDDESH